MMADARVTVSLDVLAMCRSGRFDEVRDRFVPQLQSLVSEDMLRVAWSTEMGRLGAVRDVGAPVVEAAPSGAAVVRIPLACERGGVVLAVTLTAEGRLAGLQFAPPSAVEPPAPWVPPDYADPALFDEADVMVGAGDLAVPGVLSLPHGAQRRPALVLLAGSGANDRDETIGVQKPFKDVAWGLASRGITVLRFDKVTFARPQQAAANPAFTLDDEYLPQALAGIHLLQEHPGVDAGRVFLLGHSLGGTVAPRVAAAEPRVAGIILMAGGIQPLHWNLVRQVRYIASHSPDTAAAAESTVQALTAQAQRVDAPDLSPSTPPGELPLGVPASYWLDLRSYDPAKVAARLGKPILVLQGGRDYQVTVEDDLRLWREGLAGCAGVTVRVYPADNHLFFSGSGPSLPSDYYEAPQHVDPAVIGDIAAWLASPT